VCHSMALAPSSNVFFNEKHGYMYVSYKDRIEILNDDTTKCANNIYDAAIQVIASFNKIEDGVKYIVNLITTVFGKNGETLIEQLSNKTNKLEENFSLVEIRDIINRSISSLSNVLKHDGVFSLSNQSSESNQYIKEIHILVIAAIIIILLLTVVIGLLIILIMNGKFNFKAETQKDTELACISMGVVNSLAIEDRNDSVEEFEENDMYEVIKEV
jgi:hypothetical protein